MSTYLTTIEEKFSKTWPFVAISSSVLAILLLIYSRINSDILISGYLDLASFIFFAVAVLSYFKLRDGRISIRIEINREEKELAFSYLLNGSVVSSEKLPIDKQVEFKTGKMPDTSLYTEINQTDRTIRFRENPSASWRYLFQYNSRIIPLSREVAKRTAEILSEASAQN